MPVVYLIFCKVTKKLLDVCHMPFPHLIRCKSCSVATGKDVFTVHQIRHLSGVWTHPHFAVNTAQVHLLEELRGDGYKFPEVKVRSLVV